MSSVFRQIFVLLFVIIFFSEIRAQTNPGVIQGEITDQNGGLISQATVSLTINNQTQTFVTDENGRFIFKNLSAGVYSLKVEAPGFDQYEETFLFEDVKKAKRFSITLFPIIRENVEIDNLFLSALDSETMAGTQVLTAREIDLLPDDPDRLNEELQNLAAAGGGIPGQATVTVDGFQAGKNLPPKSSIRSIRINPNNYSAEYETPAFQGGRVEITTKPGTEPFAGSVFFNFNDSALNAREPFARKRSPSQTRQYGFQLGFPIVQKKSGFLVSLEKRDINDVAVVNAFGLNQSFQPENFVTNVLTPKRLWIGSARADWQFNENHNQSLRFELNSNDLKNQGIGGFNLPERGFDFTQNIYAVRFIDALTINPQMTNEFRAGFTLQKSTSQALSDEQIIFAAGAFTSGGASTRFLETVEKRLEIADNLIFVRGKHTVKLGLQSSFRNVTNQRADNQNGAFYFGGVSIPGTGENISGLEQYRRVLQGVPNISPTRFSATLGTLKVGVNQWRVAGFIQDDWQIRKNLTLNLGFRYETQTTPTDFTSFAPRFGIAFVPDKQQKWILRVRGGVFYDRLSEILALETLRLDGAQLKEIIIDSPSFPNPGSSFADSISTIRIFNADLRPTGSLQIRAEFERQLTKGWKISATHSWTRNWDELRSRNINAPLIDAANPNPQTARRPLGVRQNILQFETNGRTFGRVITVNLNQSSNKYYTFNLTYLNFDFKTDADDAFSFPQSSYSLSGEYAPPFWQSRHRVFVNSNINLPKDVKAAVSFTFATGTPFNITTGRDNNGDGNFNDRPSLSDAITSDTIMTRLGNFNPNIINGNLPRNFGTNPINITANLNFSRTFDFGKKDAKGIGTNKLTANIRVNNLFNRTNLLNLNGVLNSPLFGLANASAPARRIEFGLRFSF